MSPYYEGIMKHACKKAHISAQAHQERVAGCKLRHILRKVWKTGKLPFHNHINKGIFKISP